jgi:Protein of unknown function (DUF2934)
VDDQERQRKLRERAYMIWERGRRPEGREGQHWRIAEEELRAEEQQAQGEAPALEAVRTAREADRSTSSERRRGEQAGPAAEAARTARRAGRGAQGEA